MVFKICFIMHKFFHYEVDDEPRSVEYVPVLTPMLVPCQNSDGSIFMRESYAEKETNPLIGLTFSDFSLSAMLKHGISLKPLKIDTDMRLGHDEEIDSLNDFIDSHVDDLFNINEK